MSNLWGNFKNEVLGACGEVCGKKRSMGSKGDTWWWTEEVNTVQTLTPLFSLTG